MDKKTKKDESYVELSGPPEEKKKEGGKDGERPEPPAKPDVKPQSKEEKGKDKKIKNARDDKSKDKVKRSNEFRGSKKEKKRRKRMKELVETDIDKLYEMVRESGTLRVGVAAKRLGIDMEQIEEWGRVLEQHKLIKLHYPPVGDPVLILKKFKIDAEEIKRAGKKKVKFSRRVFLINIAIIVVFFAFVLIQTLGIPTLRISYNQLYLAAAVIIIIVAVLLFKMRRSKVVKSRGKEKEKPAKKKGLKDLVS